MPSIYQADQVYYEFSTRNTSFIELANYYKDIGIHDPQWRWPLILLDPDLAGVDPYDPGLSRTLKIKVLREVIQNPIYFFRDVVKVPVDGNNQGVHFKIHRGNAALIWCAMMNLNIFLEQPRQTYKTISTLCWYLWVYNFGSRGSEMSFLHKKFDDSKLNLARLKEIRDLLPSYLRMDKPFAADGTKLKARDNVESLSHPVNGNNIRTIASARSKTAAASLLRGRTTPIIYIDEYAFITYNSIIYTNMVPAFNTAANNAKVHGSPYGMLLTTTPGIMTTDEGIEAFKFKEKATPFSEQWYNLSYPEIMDIINSNQKSNFVYIKFTYKQLGFSEEWFKGLCIQMQDWTAVMREVLLVWSVSNDNSPFKKEDLDTIRNFIKPPIQSVLILNKFKFDIYMRINLKYPPIIGVDVSGGFQRDSSAITVIDSYTTNVAATMNCNYISTLELAAVLIELVRMMPNAIVNIERNGGYGATVIAKLLNSPIKKNLYFTIKDKVIEERITGAQIQRRTQKTKVYGSDSSHTEREKLIEILRERVEYHKDKINSQIIYEELCGLEVKKNGRVEHSTNTHDDQIFSWLWALYVYYYGGDLMNNWGITKRVLKTDTDLEEAVYDISVPGVEITNEIESIEDEDVQEQLDELKSSPGQKMYNQWVEEQAAQDQKSLDRLLATKLGRDTFEKQFHMDLSNSALGYGQSANLNIPDQAIADFYSDPYAEEDYNVLQGNLASLWNGGGF